MELVAFVGSDKENLLQVLGLVKKGNWDKVIIVGYEPVLLEKSAEFIKIGSERILEMRDEIKKKISGKISGTEVALTIASGNGKEHMALISAILSLPAGIRFVALTKEGVAEL